MLLIHPFCTSWEVAFVHPQYFANPGFLLLGVLIATLLQLLSSLGIIHPQPLHLRIPKAMLGGVDFHALRKLQLQPEGCPTDTLAKGDSSLLEAGE